MNNSVNKISNLTNTINLTSPILFDLYIWHDKLFNKIDTLMEEVNYIFAYNKLHPILPSTIKQSNEYILSLPQFNGHINKLGKSAGIVKNTIYLDKPNNIAFVNCGDNIWSIIDYQNHNKIQNYFSEVLTWYKLSNGYIGAHTNLHNAKIIYLHQYLMHIGKDQKDNLSVDHINRDKLDNRLCNLRWADQSTQNENRDKVARHKNAQELPDGIGPLPKYVTYNKEIYDKTNGSEREFFRIESHPLLPIVWSSSKSNKVSIVDKYNETLNRLKELSEGKIITESKFIYPVGIRHNQDKNMFILDWRDKVNNERFNMRMVLDKTLSTETNYKLFIKKIKDKYPNLVFE